MSFNFDSYSSGLKVSSYLASPAYTGETTLYEIRHEEFGIVIQGEESNSEKIAVLWTNSKRILKVNKRRLNYIRNISPWNKGPSISPELNKT